MVEIEEELRPENDSMTLTRQERSKQLAPLLLQWFESNKREFPWRPAKDPYQAAVAEILLQKTSATNARPIFEQFIHAYPTVHDLAAADPAALAEMLRPLGIPRRALLIQQLAKEVIANHGGNFPKTEEELRALPGLGPYGAGAVASQAFSQRAPMIDINVMRIFGRVFSIKYSPRAGPPKRLREAVLEAMPHGDEGRFNLALLDFGALVCRRREPLCASCPLARLCDYNLAQQRGVSVK